MLGGETLPKGKIAMSNHSNSIRIATFNIENLDDRPDLEPSLATRAKVLRPALTRLRADIICFQEVHGQTAGRSRDVKALKELLKGTRYEKYHMVTTTEPGKKSVFSQRNLVIVSKFPIKKHAQYLHDLVDAPDYRMVTADPKQAEAEKLQWERPILHATIELEDGRLIEVVNVHLKSKLPTEIPGGKLDRFTWKSNSAWAEGFFLSSMKRVGQALEVRCLVDQLFDADPDANIFVCGDFNADSDEVPVLMLRGPVEETGNGALQDRVLIPCESSIPEQSRFSIKHHGKGHMFDHVLISRAMLGHYLHTEIHNEDLPDESIAFATDVKFPQADHAPVVAEFCFIC